MTRIYHRILTAASALMLMLTGCVNEDAPCPDTGDEGTGVTLQFTVVTHGASTASRADGRQSSASENSQLKTDNSSRSDARADDCDDGPYGSPAENYINTADCQFLLFDADGVLLRTIFPEISVDNKDDEEVEYTWYSIKASISEPYFDTAIKTNPDGDVTFYIMVIANSHSQGLNGQYPGLVPGTTTIADIANQQLKFDLPSQGLLYDDTYWTSSWAPNIDEKKFIPMSGLQKFTVSTKLLKDSSYDAPVELSGDGGKDIDMLRAMAKIEVIDKIGLPDGYNSDIKRLKVEKVEIIGFYRKGTILPQIGTTGQWPNYVSENIESPNLPPLSNYAIPVPFKDDEGYAANNQGKITIFEPDEYSSSNHHDNYPVQSCYITEYSREAVGNNAKPYLVITLVDENSNPDDDKDKRTSYFKELKLDKYVDGAPTGDGIEFLLRNHIYRYEIIGVNSEANIIEVGYTVCDWNEPTVDIPTFD